MPIDMRLEQNGRRVVATMRGAVTLDEIKKSVGGVLGNPSLRPGFQVLSDHTEIEQPLTTEAVRGFVAYLEANQSALVGVRWAIVTRKPASYGMMRMMAVYAEGALKVRVFLDMGEAEAWLEPTA